MQIIRANHLHAEKEVWKENVHRQQEKGGYKEIISLGAHTKCPQCERIGRVVWISEDKKTAGIQCPATHHNIIRPKSRYGPTPTPSKTSKNMVFLVEMSSLPNL